MGQGGGKKIPSGQITATVTDNAFLSLKARTIAINGPLKGGYLIVEAGKGPHNATDTLVDQPLAIDVSDLGGMYAQRITLISNDQGAGVNLNNLHAGSAQLDTHGRITLTNTTGTLCVTGDQLHLTGKHSANSNIYLTSRGDINTNEAILTAGYNLNIKANGEITHHASTLDAHTLEMIGSSLNADNATVIKGNNIRIKLGNHGHLAGQVQATDSLSLRVETLDNQGELSGKSIHTEAKILNNSGDINANKKLSLYVTELLTQSESGKMESEDISLEGNLFMPRIEANSNTNIYTAGLLNSHQLSVNARSWHNSANVMVNMKTWLNDAQAYIKTQHAFDNEGILTVTGKLTMLNKGALNNHNSIKADELDIFADTLNNHGFMQGESDINAWMNLIHNTQNGKITGDKISLNRVFNMQNEGKIINSAGKTLLPHNWSGGAPKLTWDKQI